MFKKIKSFFVSIFHKQQTKKIAKINESIKKPDVLSWGLVVPHEKNKPGATAFNQVESEYVYWQVVYNWLSLKWIGLPKAFRNEGGLKGAYKKLKNEDCNASIECHYNAFNKRAHGIEVLVLAGDQLSAKYALLFVRCVLKHFPDRNVRGKNGIRWVKSGDNGALNLIRAKEQGMKIALLPEAFFGDNKNDYIPHEKMAQILNEFFEEAAHL